MLNARGLIRPPHERDAAFQNLGRTIPPARSPTVGDPFQLQIRPAVSLWTAL
jgi:hypothetical protein